MARNLATAKAHSAPPPFWQQLPRVFTYPAHGDAIVKIVCFALAAGLVESFGGLFGYIIAKLIWLGFLAYCFRILERTARGHLNPAEMEMNERTDKDPRPLLQLVIFIIFMGLVILATAMVGELAGQVMMVVVALVLPASIMVLALDERLGPALNPLRLMATIAGIGLPYLALCAFLFLLLESSEYLADGLDIFLPDWAAETLADMVTMYFMISMYYLMGYALYQNHEALGVDVQVDTAAAGRAVARKSGEPDLLGPETQGLIGEGKLDEAAGRIENRLRREWENNKLHDQYQKLLLLGDKPKEITRHVNEYVPKLMREKKAARAVEVYEAAKKKVPDLLITDGTLILPLATTASELRRDATAFELLKGFDKRFPKHDDIPGVYMLAARILLEKQNQYAMAQKIFQGIVQKFPQHPLAAEAARLAEVAGKMAAAPGAA